MKDKQKEQEEYIEKYNASIKRGFELLDALEDYDKNTINKTFFEKYFTRRDENGEVKRDWQKNIATDFSINKDDKTWTDKNLSIYLSHNEKIEFATRDRAEIINATKEEIDKLKNWIDKAIIDRDFYRDFDLVAFKDDIEKLKEKYNASDYWYTIHDKIRF